MFRLKIAHFFNIFKQKVMKSTEKDLLDLVFEHRNKSYGAYFLRRNYPIAMRNALFLTIGGLVAAFAVPYLLAAANRPEISLERPIIDIGTPPNIETKEVPPPPKVVPSPTVSRPTIRIVPPIVLPNDEVTDEPDLADLDKPIEAEIGKKTVAGDPDAPEIFDGPVDLDELKKVEVVKTVPTEEILTFVESMPAFPGGHAAFLQYFSEKFVYPTLARETGIQGRVSLSFIVEKSGELTDIKAVKGIGGGVEAEAIRVLKSMPRWKPGNQNGNLVRVRMNLPIMVCLE